MAGSLGHNTLQKAGAAWTSLQNLIFLASNFVSSARHFFFHGGLSSKVSKENLFFSFSDSAPSPIVQIHKPRTRNSATYGALAFDPPPRIAMARCLPLSEAPRRGLPGKCTICIAAQRRALTAAGAGAPRVNSCCQARERVMGSGAYLLPLCISMPPPRTCHDSTNSGSASWL